MSIEQEPLQSFFLAFYEDGKFSNYLGQPQSTLFEAQLALSAYKLSISNVLPVKSEGPNRFSYDRYGTACAVVIVDEEGKPVCS